ncbi:hypothetical protein GCM10011507_14230 [Edaphobacter acidisoli]|uniref:PpiC domain-containing protein n=1 Tax=Edaphobacter acidisoli TaxID=2040573 RepID=A0A916RP91_9BACT|nr:peptidylprolyl isomerase [Edaphobacter acidisoli]GGA63798.1 hypothetical protein GCM10011507_14230 [Edaphobacter acidisoli]
MNLKISEIVVLCGLGLLITPGALAQVPQYQGPLSTAAQPAAALPAPTPITPNGSVVEDIVARVNDRIITRSDYERAARELTQEERQDNDSPQQTAERQKNLLRDLIDQQLLLSRGKDLGINADAEVIRRLDEIRKQNHMSSMEELQKAAESQGVSFEDFKANIRNSIITQEVVRDEVGSKLQLSPSQEQEYYEQHKQEFAQPEQVRLSEILISTPSDPSDAQVAAAKAKADEVSAKIKAGQNFADLAKQYSSDPTGTQGGDLGTYKRGALAKVLEDQTFDLQTGGVTAPIRTRQGFVILKVTDHQKAGVPPLKDIEPQIQEAIYMAQMQPALRAYLTKLREDAYIEIKDGFVDSGASPRETRPVYTSYALPTVKKKKVVEKTRFDRTGRLSQRKAVAAKPVSAAPSGANLVASNKKHKKVKIKKEKIRFGQAPRNALPAGPLETSTGTDQGAGANSASLGAGQAAAPGTAIAPIEAEANANPDYNPLDQQTTVHKKTRFSDRQKEFEAKKKKQKVLKAKEKTAATPTPETAEEKTTQQVQSAPLGLNGDTAKKKKKKKVKGGKKERMQQQAPASPKPAPVETPATAPGRATPQEGTPDAGKPAPAAPPSTQN